LPTPVSNHNRQGKALFLSPSQASGVGGMNLELPPAAMPTQQQYAEPELVCREKELDPNVEDEIKDGFFELR
jgi:hypothetical protein